MPAQLTDIGEEYVFKTDVRGATLTVLLYNDTTDAIGDADDLAAITTEPTNANYTRQTATFTVEDLAGDWGFDNDVEVSFNFEDQDTDFTVDSWGLIANFDSADAGDAGTPSDHLIATGELSKPRNTNPVDILNLSAGGVGVTLS